MRSLWKLTATCLIPVLGFLPGGITAGELDEKAVSADAADLRAVDRLIEYPLPYPDESFQGIPPAGTRQEPPQKLGNTNPPSSLSPGVVVGHTFYDYQHNGRMPRMVDWGYDATNGLSIHFLWMWLETETLENRKYAYNAWKDAAMDLLTPNDNVHEIQGDGGMAGYVALDVTDHDYGDGTNVPNIAVASGHEHGGDGVYRSKTYWDFSPLFLFFNTSSAVTDSVWEYGLQPTADYVIWPSMRYQDVPGNDPVLHVFSQESMPDAADPQGIYYFRKVGFRDAGTWDYPPYVVDTVFDIAQDVATSKTTGKVALTWIANRPPNLAACDTCSDNDGDEAVFSVQLDNDIYYQISNDFGATWQPRVNLTKNIEGEAGYRPYTDMQALISSDENLHIAWSGRVWPADPEADGVGFDCRMFHWGEALGFETGGDGYSRGRVRTVANLEWDQTTCNGGAWQMNGSKMNIGECNGRLYYNWTQFNNIPAGDTADCAQRGLDGTDVVGSANGELWLSVSNNLDGLLWDAPRNLTNSPSPGCDPAGGGDPCDSDHWSSMARFGYNETDYGGTNIPDTAIVDPSGSYAGSHYIPIQYIHDIDAGGIVQDEGTWQESHVTWFSLACVTPVETKLLAVSPNEVGYPAYTPTSAGTTGDTTLTLENTGNADLTANYSITMSTDGSISPSSGSETVLAGFNNTVDLPITFSKGTGTSVAGELTFSGSFDNSPVTVPLEWFFVDTIISPTWDTVYVDDGTKANALALTVANNGNKGRQGVSRVNLDYFEYGDCDVYPEGGDDPYPGDASIYLYDGSKVICWDEGGTPVCEASVYASGAGFGGLGETGGEQTRLMPRDWLSGGFVPGAYSSADVIPDWLPEPAVGNPVGDFFSSTYYTRDMSIQIDELTFAPDGPTNPNWVVQATRFTNLTGSEITGLAIGEFIDWNIPSDSGYWNNSGFDASRRLMYQIGSEFDQDDECQDNNLRYGGVAVAAQSDGTEGSWDEATYGMYTLDNPTQVYPFEGLNDDSLWKYMEWNSGFSVADSTDADLHSMATYQWNYSLTHDGQLLVYTCLVTEKDGETAFLAACDECLAYVNDNFFFGDTACCQRGTGDFNGDGAGPDISDLMYATTWLFSGGPEPQCPAEANTNGCGVWGDVLDLLYMIEFMFSGGASLAECYDFIDQCPTDTICNISLGSVDGQVAPGIIPAGTPITFNVRAHNTSGFRVHATSNGFRLYSPDGAEWSSTTGAFTDTWLSQTNFDGGEFVTLVSSDGTGADTIGFAGYVLGEDGMPGSYNQESFSITIGAIDEAHIGKTVCIDSVWYPPNNTWAWGSEYGHSYHPAWDGPYCFLIDTMANCICDCGDVNNDGENTQNDVTVARQYLFEQGLTPPDLYVAEGDGYELFTISDLAVIMRCLALGAPCPVCPASEPPLDGPVDTNIFVHPWQASYPPPEILPPGADNFKVTIELVTNRELTVASIPVAIRIGPDIPQIDSVNAKFVDSTIRIALTSIDHANGIVDIGVMCVHPDSVIPPGRIEIAEAFVYVSPTPDSVWRPILMYMDSLGPIQNGRCANYPFAVAGNPFDGEAYALNTTKRYPCEGLRGNAVEPLGEPMDISDLVATVTYMFNDADPPVSFEEVDVNASLTLDIADIVYFVTYMFQNGPPPFPCPEVPTYSTDVRAVGRK
jgi:hypothetical protein